MRALKEKFDFLEIASYASFIGCALFCVLFSSMLLEFGPKPWNKAGVLLAYTIPIGFVFLWRLRMGKWPKSLFGIEFRLVFASILFGFLNILFSDDLFTTVKIMTLFQISGFGAYLVARSVMIKPAYFCVYFWTCWFCLVVFCCFAVHEYFYRKLILGLAYNQIISSGVLILLSVGPLVLVSDKRWSIKWLQAVSILFALTIIVMMGKRGAILGIIGMAFAYGILVKKRMGWLVLVAALVAIGAGYKHRSILPKQLTRNIFSEKSTIFRLENYFFAKHVFLSNPFFGTGLHAPLNPYLDDYTYKVVKKPDEYKRYVEEKYTLENMVLCSLVEMGALFTIVYSIFIFIVFKKFYSDFWKNRALKNSQIVFCLPFIGFFIQSITFDSLVCGNLNFLFHVHLGMMANFGKLGSIDYTNLTD